MSRIDFYGVGPVSASVCALNDVPLGEVTDELNKCHPTGIASEWQPSTNERFATGESNPCPCNVDPHGRRHYLFHC